MPQKNDRFVHWPFVNVALAAVFMLVRLALLTILDEVASDDCAISHCKALTRVGEAAVTVRPADPTAAAKPTSRVEVRALSFQLTL